MEAARAARALVISFRSAIVWASVLVVGGSIILRLLDPKKI